MSAASKEVTDPRELFSINRIRFLLKAYGPPEGDFDPEGAWTGDYTHYSLGYWNNRRQGTLRIQRTPTPSGGAAFVYDAMRLGRTGYNHHVHAEVQARTDATGTPLSWTMDAKLAKSADSEPYLHSGLRKTAKFEQGVLKIAPRGDVETVRIPGLHACKWGLIDVAQRLPRKEGEKVEFSLVDEFDKVHHNQYLAWRTEVALALKDGIHTLTAYEHIGEGVIPTVYWVDKGRRVLFVVTGTEYFLLNRSNDVQADFDDKPFIGPLSAKMEG